MTVETFYGNLISYNVMPTENDHYGSGYGGIGAGMIPQELTLTPLIGAQSVVAGHVVSGFTPPSSGSLSGGKIQATVAAGEAVINGYRIIGESTIAIEMTISDTSYLFLQLEYDANSLVYRPVVYVDDGTYSRPLNSIPLGEVTCDATSVTATVDLRPQNKLLYGEVQGSDGSTIHRGSEYWSASRTGTGAYTLTFSPALLCDHPYIFTESNSTANIDITSLTAASCTVTTRDGAGTPTDYDWRFMVYS